MAKVNETPLLRGSSQAGAMMWLRDKARDSTVLEFVDHEIETVSGSRALLVRHKSAAVADYTELVDAAQVGLDLYAIKHGISLAVDEPRGSYVRWWTDEHAGLVVQAVSVVPLMVDVPSIKLTVTDKDGVDVTSPEPILTWHLSARHFRLSQLSSDTADSYRHLYLAVEAVLSDIFPQTSGGEKMWTVAAFNEANRLYGLEKYSPLAAGLTEPGDALHTDFAAEARHLLNHSKVNKPHMVPMDLADRATLQEKHARLTDLCVHLMREHLTLGRMGGYMTPAWHRHVRKQTLPGGTVEGVHSDVRPTPDFTAPPHDEAGVHVAVPSTQADPQLGKWIYTVQGTFGPAELGKLGSLNQWHVFGNDGKAHAWADFNGDVIDLSDVARLDILTGFSLVNVRGNRHDFAT